MKKKVFLIPIALIAFSIFMSSIVVTKPGEFRVIKQFGRIVRVEENDGSNYGLSWKIPFIQSETVISSKVRLSDLPASDVMTSDKKSMISDCFVLWKIEEPVALFSMSVSSLYAQMLMDAGSMVLTKL